MKKVFICLLYALLLLTGIACSSNETTPPTTTTSESTETTPAYSSQTSETDPNVTQPPQNDPIEQQPPVTKNNESKGTAKTGKNPIVTIEMADGGKLRVELYPAIAPNTVNNFISLVQKGFYNGLIFHRVIPGFMIQGGDPQGTGIGNPGYSIKGEFAANSFPNNLKHERGVISMARSSLPDSAGSQFFIMVSQTPRLDGDYAAFGKVIEGMEAVDKIVNTPRSENDKPITEQKMKKVTIETFGVNYEEPVKTVK